MKLFATIIIVIAFIILGVVTFETQVPASTPLVVSPTIIPTPTHIPQVYNSNNEAVAITVGNCVKQAGDGYKSMVQLAQQNNQDNESNMLYLEGIYKQQVNDCYRVAGLTPPN